MQATKVICVHPAQRAYEEILPSRGCSISITTLTNAVFQTRSYVAEACMPHGCKTQNGFGANVGIIREGIPNFTRRSSLRDSKLSLSQELNQG